jgi:hypothetical protein
MMELIFARIVLNERYGSCVCHKCTEYERDVFMEME